MRAIVLPRIAPIEEAPLREVEIETPQPAAGEILLKVSACGLCHTDLDEIEGRLEPAALPMVLGHQVVGTVAARGEGATRFSTGDRVGVTWLFSSCGTCEFCRSGRENLCHRARWTGKDVPGGYAEFMIVSEDVVQPIPPAFSDRKATPIPELTYHDYLWDERKVKSVANVTRRDAAEFLPLAAEIAIRPTIESFGPSQVNAALARLKSGKLRAAGVLVFD